MPFKKMNSVASFSTNKTVKLRSDQEVDSLLRSTTVESAEEPESTLHAKFPQERNDLGVDIDTDDINLNPEGITLFPKSPQQYPSVPEIIPSGGVATGHPHSIRAKKLREMMSDWRKIHKEKHSVRNEKQSNTVYVRIISDRGLEWYTLQNDAGNVRLVLSHSDDPENGSCEQSFSGSRAEEHFEKFCSKTGLMYVDINADPKEIPPEIRDEVGRKLQELISKRATLDSLLRGNVGKTEEHLLDTVARWFGRDRVAPLSDRESMENSSDIAEAREGVDIARRELAEQCRQINEQSDQSELGIIIPSRTKFLNGDSKQESSSPLNLSLNEERREDTSKVQRNVLADLLTEVAITPEELSLLRKEKDSLLENLDFPPAMKERIQKLRAEATGYFSVINSMTLFDFFEKLATVRIQSHTPQNREQVTSIDQKSREVLI